MVALLLMEAKRLGVQLDLQPVSVSKRGLCTFVEKAKHLKPAGARLGIMVRYRWE